MSDPLLLVIDANNTLRKMLYKCSPLSYGGHYTQAVKGMLYKLRELENRHRPTHIAWCFDSRGKNFRHKLYPEYKANREAGKTADKLPHVTEESFHWQSAMAIKLLNSMGYCVLKSSKYEADDFIGSAATQFIERYPNGKVIIISGDKDFAQLVTKQILHMYPQMSKNPNGKGMLTTDILLDPKGVKEKFGVKPRQMVEFLAMMGDKVDNIPGVHGIGVKTAISLLAKYGSIEGIKENRKKFTPAVRAKFKAGAKKLPLWVKLVTIKCDISLSISAMRVKDKKVDEKLKKSILKELGFKEELTKYRMY